MREQPLDGDAIRDVLAEVAAELPADGPQHTLVIVGGSLLAWQGLRSTTADVDSVRRLDEDVQAAVRTVGERRGLAPRWLNDRSAMFAPVTLREEDCHLLMELPGLRVLGAPLSQVFLMKLYAGRARDYDDLLALWPRAGFPTPEDAAAAYAEAYPHAPNDAHLAEFVRDLAAEAEAGGV